MGLGSIGLEHFLILSAAIFSIGVLGLIINRKNIIMVFLSIEIMLLAVNINLVAFSYFLNDLTGQIFSIFVITVAAAEAAVGLGIMINYFRHKNSINIADIKQIQG